MPQGNTALGISLTQSTLIFHPISDSQNQVEINSRGWGRGILYLFLFLWFVLILKIPLSCFLCVCVFLILKRVVLKTDGSIQFIPSKMHVHIFIKVYASASCPPSVCPPTASPRIATHTSQLPPRLLSPGCHTADGSRTLNLICIL